MTKDRHMNKKEILEKEVQKINKIYGAGSVMFLSQKEGIDIERISTRSLSIDSITGGGFPRGRIVHIYGKEGSGKTTIAMLSMIEAQEKGGVAAIIDLESSFNRDFFQMLGGDLEKTIIAQPSTAEEAWEICDQLIDSGAIDVAVFDSVSSLASSREMSGEMGDSNLGVMSRLNSQALRKITGKVSKTKTCLVLISQTRTNIGQMFGNPEIATGGNALKFYASLRLSVTQSGKIKKGEEIVGHKLKIKTQKNKTYPPFKETEVNFIYSLGIDRISEIIEIGLENGTIEKGGSWFSMFGEKVQGQESLWSLLNDNPEMQQAILKGGQSC